MGSGIYKLTHGKKNLVKILIADLKYSRVKESIERTFSPRAVLTSSGYCVLVAASRHVFTAAPAGRDTHMPPVLTISVNGTSRLRGSGER